MGNDITVKIGDYKLNARVSVLIECNGKYLIENIKGNSFYNLPGGRIQIGETTEKALSRELKEELGFDISGYELKLIVISENMFTHKGSNYHEMGFVYYIKLEDNHPLTTQEKIGGLDNENQFVFWLDKSKLKDYECKPAFLYDIDPSKLTHIIIEDIK